jgi:hypothetical protein
VDQGAWRLKGIRMCTSHHLDRKSSNSTSSQFTSLPCAQDLGGENPYIDTKHVLKLLIVGDSAVRLLVTFRARSA